MVEAEVGGGGEEGERDRICNKQEKRRLQTLSKV